MQLKHIFLSALASAAFTNALPAPQGPGTARTTLAGIETVDPNMKTCIDEVNAYLSHSEASSTVSGPAACGPCLHYTYTFCGISPAKHEDLTSSDALCYTNALSYCKWLHHAGHQAPEPVTPEVEESATPTIVERQDEAVSGNGAGSVAIPGTPAQPAGPGRTPEWPRRLL